MNEFLIDFAISTVFTLLKGLVKDPKRKEAYKRVFLKIRDTITVVYDGDSLFAVPVAEETKTDKE